MSYQLKLSGTSTPLEFLMVLAADAITPGTGLFPTVLVSKNGGAFASPAGAVAEVGNGLYKLTPTTADTGTLGPLALYATAGTAYDAGRGLYEVVAYDPHDAGRLGLLNIPSGLPGTANGMLMLGTAGNAVPLFLADGMTISRTSTNSPGLTVQGSGNQAGVGILGGPTGAGVAILGGTTSGDGVLVITTNGNGFYMSVSGAGAKVINPGVNVSPNGLDAINPGVPTGYGTNLPDMLGAINARLNNHIIHDRTANTIAVYDGTVLKFTQSATDDSIVENLGKAS